ncbi:hypothetical protein N7520_007472 [Penicillium odoratum]|uniref:uncharacterized protein n=1 Tax=Penicillium odoratum TaxID=1167516 RepID=UPI0025468250|nr:uncharacterized protein N7520_007472 [Penicillium odoratum]KAJ5760316.1 hypothetical protein N7520_007472 [Penicillium odoratum]
MAELRSTLGMAHPPRDAFQIGWICALPIEAAAAAEMLDEKFGILEEQDAADSNTYTIGRIGKHHVVIACLPGGQYGTTSATTVAINMLRTFSQSLRIGLMVGIGGGVPSATHDIRLGDIVISFPEGTCGGVVQYDIGKIIEGGGLERTGSLNSPPKALLTAVSTMRASGLTDDPRYLEYIQNAIERNARTRRNFGRPNAKSDRLFQTEHDHIPNASSCDGCPAEWEETRGEREDSDPQPHYGIIASGNKVIKHGRTREQLRLETGALCFEMEAAGLMLDFPCIVIRGVCDYADSHKNKQWQGYAALAAAAYAKDLLGYVPLSHVIILVNEVQAMTKSALSGISDIRQTQITIKYDDILQWLATDDLLSKHNDLVQRRTEGTGKWFLKSDEFQCWLKDPHQNQTLLCTGIPGAGKTVIVSLVISFLQRHFHTDTSVGTAYIYCDFKQQHLLKPWILIASLLKQLARLHPNFSRVIELYEYHQRYKSRPSVNELIDVFQAVVTSLSRVNIVIDALDECQTNDSLQRFLHIIFSLQAKYGVNISLLATSRHNGNIEGLFGSSLRSEISAGEEDIRSYLDQRVTAFTDQPIKGNEVLRADIVRKILEVANGMFLLAELYANRLADLITISDAKHMLDELDTLLTDSNDGDVTRARALDDAYKEAMSRIMSQTEQRSDLALRVLSWITCAKSPLSPSDLQYALAVEPGTRTLDEDRIASIEALVSLCSGLVVLDQKSHVVRLAHYTTQEYLDRTSSVWFPDAHIEIARVCVTYLSFDRFGFFDSPILPTGTVNEARELMDKFLGTPLCRYATAFWGYHARNTAIEEDQLILNFLQRLKPDSTYCWALRSCLSTMGSHDIILFSLQVAAHFGLAKSISKLSNISTEALPEVSLSEVIGHPTALTMALSTAARWGWRNVIKLLLDQGATIDENTMLVAVEGGAKDFLKLFIAKGPKDLLESCGLKLLERAVQNGEQDIVIILFNEGVKPDSRRLTDLISTASELGYEDITEILLNAGGTPEPTSLSLAIRGGYEGIVKLFLEAGADPEPKLLSIAIQSGHEATVKLLLDAGADPQLAAGDELPPLQNAGSGGHEAIVKLLLEAGANPEPRSLSLAMQRGHEGIVKLLLEAGANPEPRSLSLAIQRGHGGIARSLLDRGFSPDPEGLETSDLIHASKHGMHSVVDFLLDRALDIEAQDPDGWTALRWAIREGHEKVVKSLIQGGADVRSCNKGETVYELALRCDNRFVLRLVEAKLSELHDVSSETDMEPSESELDLDEGDQELNDED